MIRIPPKQLDNYNASSFKRGASLAKEMLWFFIGLPLLSCWLPGSSWRKALLELFGSRIGIGCVFKPRISVKFPWRLCLGDHTWIGERVWIDNLDFVEIGNHVCISQGAYLCTGSHDWSSPSFDLRHSPILIGDSSWICAFACLAPGTVVGSRTIVTMGSVASGTLLDGVVYQGNPARPRK